MDIKLKDFQGPMDLLLHLVSAYQMDIYQVPIVEVIEQYMDYLATLQAMRLEIAGEYMLMASQLMLIKSRRLLPTVREEVLEENDPEQELLSKLEEYRIFKQMSEVFAQQHEQRAQYFSKPKQELIYEDITLVKDKSTIDLFLAFSKILSEKQENVRKSHTTIEKEDYKIEDMMDYVRKECAVRERIALQELFQSSHEINSMITLFLAMLELIKVQEIQVAQEDPFGVIYLTRSKHESFS